MAYTCYAVKLKAGCPRNETEEGPSLEAWLIVNTDPVVDHCNKTHADIDDDLLISSQNSYPMLLRCTLFNCAWTYVWVQKFHRRSFIKISLRESMLLHEKLVLGGVNFSVVCFCYSRHVAIVPKPSPHYVLT